MSLVCLLVFALLLDQSVPPPSVLPATASRQLAASLASARAHRTHFWLKAAPFDETGRLNAFVEIARGGRRKYELDIAANKLRIDRLMPPGFGYPVNYGIVPQTISYDGDPFDVLILGPAIPSGTIVRGRIVGVMHMEDEKGLDSKVVISPIDAAGRPRFRLADAERVRMTRFFSTYKKHEPGKFSRVQGWGDAAEGLAYVKTTHAFFARCEHVTGDCALR